MRAEWKSKPLGQATTFLNGLWKGEKPPFVTVGVIRNTNFTKDGSIDDSDIAWLDVEAKKFEKRKLKFGDIILEKSGGGPKQPVGRVVLFEKDEGDYSFSNFTSAIRVNDSRELDFRFLQKFLFWKYTSGVTESMQSHSTGIRNLNADAYREIAVPLPPLAEQQRIVTILDETFAGLGSATANAEKNLENGQELFESYLNSAVGQKRVGWMDKKLSEICEVKDGTHDSPKYVERGVPFVTQKNITKEGLSLSDVRFISETDHQNFYRRSNAAFGDILISMIGANRGMACAIDDRTIFSIKNVGLIKASPNINHEYLLYFLKSAVAQEYIRVASRGGAQEFVGLTKLRDFPIFVPPQRDQLALVAALNELLKKMSQLRATYRQKLDDLNELKQSILRKAFSGELTSLSRATKEAAE
ncbi:restriction endonuclease subunit S [Bradyrhizobium barranii subsp. apii]|uniref:restriction endonuclease subunit S n=1 Tax=Bradyrhizobium barranii TaxID=2992140 RepID=UPI001AA12BFD|nr:restriction endonuclease subunit S [Bradyrhizobium barranii]UPT97834.1 restriction endonuclease subunit S [Bradyrhizobium barranii subsp. apii]